MKRSIGIAAIGAAALAVAACGGPSGAAKAKKEEQTGGLDLRRIVGTVKNPPDEFAVISKKPLEMPQDFAALPPPDPGARSTRLPDPVAEARAALLNDSEPRAASRRTSNSEAALLAASGASDPNIRAALEADQTVYEQEQELYVLDRYFPALKRLRGEDTKDLVDPTAEYQRLNTVAATPEARAARAAPIATIPSAQISRPPAAAQPTVPPVPPAAAPAAGSDGDLIFIPE